MARCEILRVPFETLSPSDVFSALSQLLIEPKTKPPLLRSWGLNETPSLPVLGRHTESTPGPQSFVRTTLVKLNPGRTNLNPKDPS